MPDPATDDLLARAESHIAAIEREPQAWWDDEHVLDNGQSAMWIRRLAARVRAAETELDAARRHRCRPYWENPDYQDWLNELMENAGDEWDDDVAMEEIAIRYVRHLEDAIDRATRTTDD